MLLECERQDMQAASVRPLAIATPRWSVLLPFFNERDYLAATLASLARQDQPVRLILIDNGSTDDSAEIARGVCKQHRLDYLILSEQRPGKVAALAAGLRRVETIYVATCDADTIYPPNYLRQAEALLGAPGAVAAGAYFAPATDAAARAKRAREIGIIARLLPGRCHTGGAGQAFQTKALRGAGGFDAMQWNMVLEDHEIINRVLKHGKMRYGERFWCSPSPRARNRGSIRWTLIERLVYALAAPIAGDWFFYRFLAPRLRARRLTSERIRERPFQSLGMIGGLSPASS